MKTLSIAIIAAVATLSAPTAFAAPKVKAQVKVSPAELTRAGGVADVHSRITSAAEKACEKSAMRGVHTRTDILECTSDLATDMVNKVPNAGLKSYHSSAMGL